MEHPIVAWIMDAICWFRKGQRLHDNPALLIKCEKLLPIFIIDPHYAKSDRISVNRWLFMLESLTDLDSNLKKIGSRLFVFRGNPKNVFKLIFDNYPLSYQGFSSQFIEGFSSHLP
ncbi:hypothetical protein ROZALSC1DRAFT_23821 [Rozella allomycis CSF55]|uniref:Photolyase/cryptochrome alpha/beta domain-containing protein n=1 Tax=Rozella allomycis (strain CSF55) TaxID=988480 RepID=A0A4P9YF17_ROZAC|nr:hypothetical protein ROZALSC1DRAFT_23821 [Rozella allomycis CSF55]